MKTYILDFKNRVTIPSIKNFQLIDNQNEVVMQFGRVGSNAFTMDFKVDYLEYISNIVSPYPVSSFFNSINKILFVILLFYSVHLLIIWLVLDYLVPTAHASKNNSFVLKCVTDLLVILIQKRNRT